MRRFISIQKWKTNYPNPIVLEQNDIVEILKKENNNPDWKKWLFCKKNNIAGWVPEQIIDKIENDKGIVKTYYSAKELNINKGEIVIAIKELNGWVWVKKVSNNEEAWLPLEILKQID